MEDQFPHRVRVAIMLATFAIAVSLCLSGVVLINRFHETNDKRALAAQRDAAISNSIRTVLCLARSSVLADKGIDRVERDRAVQFYDHALVSIHARPCGQLVIPRR
jgi:hypothetical protein